MKTANKHFRNYFKSLPESQRIQLRDDYLKRSGQSYTTFYGKLCGQNTWKPLEQDCMASIAGVTVEDMFGRNVDD